MKRVSCLFLGFCVLLGLPGCATMGTVMKIGGNLTGYGDLANAGSSMEKANREFNEEEKYYIGRTVAVTLMADNPWETDPVLTKYVNAIGQSLVLATDCPEVFKGYHFAVLKSPNRNNAFACPGGFVFITSGFMKTCQSEDELAGILAHEIAHVVVGHPMQAIKASHEREALSSLAKFGIKKVAENNADLQQLTGLFDNVVKDVAKAAEHGYSQDKEREADLMAVELLDRLGYAPSALGAVLGRLDTKSCYHGDPKVRAESVLQAAQQKGYTREVLPNRTQRFAKQVK